MNRARTIADTTELIDRWSDAPGGVRALEAKLAVAR
jgi:hypothetical protein